MDAMPRLTARVLLRAAPALLIGATAVSLVGCKAPPKLPEAPVRTSFEPEDKGRAAATTAAARKALAFAMPLDVTPWRLRDELGMKGMKHFVEKVQLLRLVAEWPGDPALATEARKAAVKTLAAVLDDRFHTLDKADDRRFRQDGMSYLRACWLAERLGFDVTAYKARIRGLLPRFEADQGRRGPDQRMSIAGLLEALGLPFAERPEDVYKQSRIGARITPKYWQQHPSNTYDLTHEIFAMTRRGERPFPFPDERDRRYAVTMVRTLLDAHMRMGNADMVAELMVNRVQLGESFDKQLEVGRRMLAEQTNKDGSVGRYDQKLLRDKKGNPRYDARIGGYLHTTMVALWALMASS